MLSDQTPVAFRFDSPEIFERGVDSIFRIRPAQAGQEITPTSATVSIYDENGTAIVTAGTATCAGGRASYTLTGVTTADLDPTDGWSAIGVVLLPGETVPRTVRADAVLALVRLYPPCAEADLYLRCPALNASARGTIAPTIPEYSGYLQDAWQQIFSRMIEEQKAPWLLSSAAPLRETHLTLTLALIHESFATKQETAFSSKAQDYRRQYEAAFSRARVPLKPAASTSLGDASTGRTGLRAPIFFGGRVR